MTLMERRRAIMGAQRAEKPIMNPAFGFTDGYSLQRVMSPPYLVAQAGCAVTDFIDGGATGNAVIYFPPTEKAIGNMLQYAADDANAPFTEWWNRVRGGIRTISLSSNTRYFRFSFDPDTLADLYGYNDATGQVYFAGVNTPYYGKTNING